MSFNDFVVSLFPALAGDSSEADVIAYEVEHMFNPAHAIIGLMLIPLHGLGLRWHLSAVTADVGQ